MSQEMQPALRAAWYSVCRESIVGSYKPGQAELRVSAGHDLLLSRSVSIHEAAHNGLNNRSVLGTFAEKLGHQYEEECISASDTALLPEPAYLRIFHFQTQDLHEGIATACELTHLPRISAEVSRDPPRLGRPPHYLREASRVLDLLPDFRQLGIDGGQLQYHLASEVILAMGASVLSPPLSLKAIEAIEHGDVHEAYTAFDSVSERIDSLFATNRQVLAGVVDDVVGSRVLDIKRLDPIQIVELVKRTSPLKAKLLRGLIPHLESGDSSYRSHFELSALLPEFPDMSRELSRSFASMAGYPYVHPSSVFGQAFPNTIYGPVPTIATGKVVMLPPTETEKAIVDFRTGKSFEKLLALCRNPHCLVIPELVGPFQDGVVLVAFHIFGRDSRHWQAEGILVSEQPIGDTFVDQAIRAAFATISRHDGGGCHGVIVSTGLSLATTSLRDIPVLETPQRGWGKCSLVGNNLLLDEVILVVTPNAMLVRLDYDGEVGSDYVVVPTLSRALELGDIGQHPVDLAYLIALRQGLHAKLRWEGR